MQDQIKIDPKQAAIGLGGLFISIGLFVLGQANIETLEFVIPISLLLALFFVGYAVSGSLISSLVVPTVIFCVFGGAGLISHLPDSSLRIFLEANIRAIGQLSFPIAILLAIYVHRRVAKQDTLALRD